MKQFIASAVVIAALSSGLAGQVFAADNVAQQIFATSEIDSDRQSGEIDGTLHITIGVNGSILGYFQTSGDFHQIDVHGNFLGKHLTLQIGDETLLYGTYSDRNIVASRLVGRDYNTFTGVRVKRQQT
jgi:hypothetical protein